MNESELFSKSPRIQPQVETWQRIVDSRAKLQSLQPTHPTWQTYAIAASLLLVFAGALTWQMQFSVLAQPSQPLSTSISASATDSSKDSLDLSNGLVAWAFDDLDPDSLFELASNTH